MKLSPGPSQRNVDDETVGPADEGHTPANAHSGRENSPLVSLLTLFSPAFPIGAFAWSHGLETAIAEDRLGIDRPGESGTSRAGSAEAVAAWIETLLDRGSGWNDGVLLVEALRASNAGDQPRFRAVADLAGALAGSAERRAETLALGTAFAEAATPWVGRETNAAFPALAYPVAVGRVAAEAGLPLA